MVDGSYSEELIVDFFIFFKIDTPAEHTFSDLGCKFFEFCDREMEIHSFPLNPNEYEWNGQARHSYLSGSFNSWAMIEEIHGSFRANTRQDARFR